jgi:hypothetical protein
MFSAGSRSVPIKTDLRAGPPFGRALLAGLFLINVHCREHGLFLLKQTGSSRSPGDLPSVGLPTDLLPGLFLMILQVQYSCACVIASYCNA